MSHDENQHLDDASSSDERSDAPGAGNLDTHSTSQLIRAVQTSLYAGPIPPPTTLAQYKDVQPDAPERILALAERQQAHRQKLETLDAWRSIVGVFAGLTVVLAAFAFAWGLATLGQHALGTATVIGAIASAAGVFVYGTLRQRGHQDIDPPEPQDSSAGTIGDPPAAG